MWDMSKHGALFLGALLLCSMLLAAWLIVIPSDHSQVAWRATRQHHNGNATSTAASPCPMPHGHQEATVGSNTAEAYWQKWAALEQRRLHQPARHRLRQGQRLDPGPMPAPAAYHAANGTADVRQFRVFGDGLGARVEEGRWVSGHIFAPPDFPQSLPRFDQLVPCRALSTCSFHIQALDATGQPVKVAADELVFRARLFGDFLVPVKVQFNSTTKLYDASYTAYDPSFYIIEVVLAWVRQTSAGEGLLHYSFNRSQPPLPFGQVVFRTAHLLYVSPATAGTTDKASGAVKPSQVAADTTVTNRSDDSSKQTPPPVAPAEGAPANNSSAATDQPSLSTPLCSSNDSVTDAPGRWVYLPGGKCQPPYCSGSSLLAVEVSDKMDFNEHYIWAPLSCHLHLYNTSDLITCAQGCSYWRWGFSGDSVGREQLQNLELLATDFHPTFDLPKLKKEAVVKRIHSHQPQRSNTGNSSSGAAGPPIEITLEMMWQKEGGDVRLKQMEDPHFLMSYPLLDLAAEHTYRRRLISFAASCAATKLPASECIYYAPTTVQRELDGANSNWGQREPEFKAITYPRMRQLHAWGVKQAKQLGLTVLDGGLLTDAHWWSSWDGLHYSEDASHYKGQFMKGGVHNPWFGGTSAMITQVLLNHLCNRPCNPGWRHHPHEFA